MTSEPILWLIFLAINIALISLVIYQIVCLTDLEADYMNAYESSSRINSVVLKEYILHGAFCILFLVTGHWFIFLLTLLPGYYNVRKFLSRQHLIDVTEVFRFIESEKKIRIFKLGFYLVLFVLVLVRYLGIYDYGRRLVGSLATSLFLVVELGSTWEHLSASLRRKKLFGYVLLGSAKSCQVWNG